MPLLVVMLSTRCVNSFSAEGSASHLISLGYRSTAARTLGCGEHHSLDRMVAMKKVSPLCMTPVLEEYERLRSEYLQFIAGFTVYLILFMTWLLRSRHCLGIFKDTSLVLWVLVTMCKSCLPSCSCVTCFFGIVLIGSSFT